MCGRYTMGDPRRCLAEFSILEKEPALEPRFNITPSQGVWVVRINQGSTERSLDLLRWGLLRHKNVAGGLAMVRAESLATKGSFGEAFRHRRCLLLADGFYEWRRAGGRSYPHYIHRPGGAPFVMAGIWQAAPPAPGQSTIDACAVVTRPAEPPVADLHDRMPAILSKENIQDWLDPEFDDTRALTQMLAAHPGFELETVAVGPRVNSPANDDPSCIAPATEADRRGEQFELWPRDASFRTG